MTWCRTVRTERPEAPRVPSTIAGIKGGRLDVRAAPRVSIVGVAEAADHVVRLPILAGITHSRRVHRRRLRQGIDSF